MKIRVKIRLIFIASLFQVLNFDVNIYIHFSNSKTYNILMSKPGSLSTWQLPGGRLVRQPGGPPR